MKIEFNPSTFTVREFKFQVAQETKAEPKNLIFIISSDE